MDQNSVGPGRTFGIACRCHLAHEMHAVILVYDPDTIPSRDSRFPDPEDDFLMCRCFPVVGQDADAVVVEYKGSPLTIFKDRVKMIDDPVHKVGDRVRTLASRPPRTGVVEQIVWHFKDDEPKFFISTDGRLIDSTAYRQSELISSCDQAD